MQQVQTRIVEDVTLDIKNLPEPAIGRIISVPESGRPELNDLHLSRTGNRWAITGDLDDLAGTTVDEAVRAATDKPTADDLRSPAKRRADFGPRSDPPPGRECA